MAKRDNKENLKKTPSKPYLNLKECLKSAQMCIKWTSNVLQMDSKVLKCVPNGPQMCLKLGIVLPYFVAHLRQSVSLVTFEIIMQNSAFDLTLEIREGSA